ncbi:MAG: hypothetical protein AB7U76_24990 [Pirellulales bacterium]
MADMDETEYEVEDTKADAVEDNIELFRTLKQEICADIDWSAKWRKQADEDFKFSETTGQWDTKDKQMLDEQKRPLVTFNKVNKYIRAICGIEANNRHETVFLPRELDNVGEVKANETLTAASEWMEDGCHAQRHQSRAFRDAATCGMGWTEAIIEWDEDPDGKYAETRVDPREMVWDRDARDQNVMDAKRVARIRKMPAKDARALLRTDEDVSLSDLDASWANDLKSVEGEDPKTIEQKEMREENSTGPDETDGRHEVTIVQVQWWEYETYYRAADPQMMTDPMYSGPSLIDMDEDQFAQVNRQFGASMPKGKWPGTKMRRKVYKQAILGNKVLDAGPAPCPDCFTLNAVTWEPNSDGTWSGLIRDLRDPQQWANKYFSQLMHIINSTSKGGIIAESDAFADVQEAQRNYARPDGIVVVNPGAIRNNKIMAKPGQGLTTGVLSLLEISDRMFSDVSGINVELMGMADREQAGILEAQRKQSAMMILATLFDSMNLMRERIGRVRLHYIQTILADGRLIRVAGEDSKQAIQLIRDKVLGKYDVVVSDAPTSPNSKERVWASIQTLLPPLMSAGMVKPEHVLMLLDYVPGFPSKLVQSFREMAQKPDPAAMEQAELAKRSAIAEVSEKEASAQSKHASAVLSFAKAAGEQNDANIAQFEAALQAYQAAQNKPMPQQPDEQVMGGNGQTAPQQPPPLPDLGQAAPVQETNAPMPGGLALPGGLAR